MPVELVGIHVVATTEVGKLTMKELPNQEADEAEARKGKRDVDYALDGIHQTTLYDGDKLLPSMEFIGPAIIEDSGATTVIHPENKVYIDGYKNIHIEI
jgi:N-methylhydantoinase A